MLETLLRIILQVFHREIIISSLFLYFMAILYLLALSILFTCYKRKDDFACDIFTFVTFVFSFIINIAMIFIICSFIVQSSMAELSFPFLWKIFISMVVISYALIFLALPKACFSGLIFLIIILSFSFIGKTFFSL